jgi:hypothetical protein
MLLAMGAPDRHCSLSGAPPRHPTVRVRSEIDRWSFVSLRHRKVWCHNGQSGALWLRGSDFYHCTIHVVSTFAVDRCAQIVVARWHTGQSGGTPDSSVNYSGACVRKPESGCLDPIRSWCTGHCSVAHRTVQCARPQHTWFLLLLWIGSLSWIFICLCWTFMHLNTWSSLHMVSA